jgi:hypothetical protein
MIDLIVDFLIININFVILKYKHVFYIKHLLFLI